MRKDIVYRTNRVLEKFKVENKIYAKIQKELKFMPLMMVGMEMLAVMAGKKMIVAAGGAV